MELITTVEAWFLGSIDSPLACQVLSNERTLAKTGALVSIAARLLRNDDADYELPRSFIA